MNRSAFLAALRSEIVARYSTTDNPSGNAWATDPAKVDNFIALTRETMETDHNRVNIDGAAYGAAWRAIGGRGRLTFKALRALPAD